MRLRNFGPPAGLPRRGFTLIELLVVIAIISILAALSASASIKYIQVQNEKNTGVTINALSGALKKHRQAVIDSARDKENVDAYPVIKQMAGGNAERARAMYIAFRLKQEFPMTYAEALNPAPLPPKSEYVSYLASKGITAASPSPLPHESSACLYMALTQSTGGTRFNADQMGNAVKSFPAGGTNQISAFTDSWGNPIAFYRLNTDAAAVAAVQRGTGKSDTIDPTATFLATSWAGRNWFEQNAPLPLNATAQPNGFSFVPVLVSPGPNGKLGLDPVSMAVTNAADASDNIYSYQLQRE